MGHNLLTSDLEENKAIMQNFALKSVNWAGILTRTFDFENIVHCYAIFWATSHLCFYNFYLQPGIITLTFK
jgi:hypothetical protein